MIERKDVDQLCELSRIGMNDEEKEQLTKELGSILNYVKAIEQVDVSSVERTEGFVTNVMRPDSEPHLAETFTAKLIDQAPDSDGLFVKVQKILNPGD